MSRPERILPPYPRIQHFPYNPNKTDDDPVAPKSEADKIFTAKYVYTEEKIDGSQCAMCLYEDNPIIRGRTHFLNKGNIKEGAASKQFGFVFNWFYKNKKKFEELNDSVGGPIGVYGEWMVATHGQEYDKLPDWFIPYELYDYTKKQFLDPTRSHYLLSRTGFDPVRPRRFDNIASTTDNLAKLALFVETSKSEYCDNLKEGIVIKISNDGYITDRFKMVRSDFVQGALWDDKKLVKNKLRKMGWW